MNPLSTCVWIASVAAAACWITSVLTRENSWVDRIWSIIPVVYLWVFAGAADLRDPRLDLMAGLVTLWGARLTFNFARKGGGYAKGGEDYRWAVLRNRMAPWQFQVFNLLFIAGYQNLILLAISLPAATALDHRGHLGVGDIICAVVFLVLLAGETVADQQQWNFHAWKRAEMAAGRRPSPGFVSTGLFRFSRHPNFFCEIGQWWLIFAFGAIAAGSPVQWTVIGAVLLTLLFIGSTRFTEQISRSKYPEYEDYGRRTSAIVPWAARTPRSTAAR